MKKEHKVSLSSKEEIEEIEAMIRRSIGERFREIGILPSGSRGAIDEQASRRGLLKPVEQAQQAGLAATRSALDDDEAATFNRQIDALEEGLVIAEVQTSSLQVDSHHRTSAAVWFAGTPA